MIYLITIIACISIATNAALFLLWKYAKAIIDKQSDMLVSLTDEMVKTRLSILGGRVADEALRGTFVRRGP